LEELITRLSGREPLWLPRDEAPLMFGRLRLSLNPASRPFPAHLAAPARLLEQEALLARLWPEGAPALQARLEGVTAEQWEFLSERWLQEPLEAHPDARLLLAPGEERDWLLSGEDHLRLGWRGGEAALAEGAALLDREALALEADPGLALGPAGERLVANPFLCGSGCHVALVLHLPALAWWGQVEEHLDPLFARGVSYRTWQEGFGDFLVLENVDGSVWPPPPGESRGPRRSGRPAGGGPAARTLGRLLEALRGLEEAEQAARHQLRKHRRLEVEDRVQRALALCRSARLMGYPELVEHLSLLRLGRQLAAAGWHFTLPEPPFSPLLLHLAPAHLSARSDAGLGGRQAAALRARLLRAALAE
jgi:protein arginine kinase